MLIQDQKSFELFLEEAASQEAVAIDTEFLRDRTYWPKLCLLQMAIKEKSALVDPFEVDVRVIKSLLLNENVVKVFHSPRQDLEILYNEVGVLPNNIFDTQIAASFKGNNSQIGYGNLVFMEFGIRLNKADSFTDWSMRPLSKSQLKYAEEDVTYLLDLYYKMVEELKSLGRIDWVLEDINDKYLDEKLYSIDPNERFRHLKRVMCLSPRQLACAREISSWREKTAIKRDVPRKWVLSDDSIVEISKKSPQTLNDLLRFRGIKAKLSTKDCRSILEAVDRGLKCKKEDLPDINDVNNSNNYNCDVSDSLIDIKMDLFSALVKMRASENNIAPQILSSNKDLNKICHGIKDNIPTLTGWRKDIVGDDLLKLFEGKLILKIKDHKPIIKEVDCV